MDVPNVLLAVTCTPNLIVVWFVYERDRNNRTNQLFSLFTLFVALWALIILLFRSTDNPIAALILIKFSYISALVLAFCFYQFSLIFPKPAQISPIHRVATYATTIFVSLGLLSRSVIVQAIVLEPWGKQVILEPIGWTVFSATFLFFFIGAQIRLLRKIPLAEGAERMQLIVVAATVIIVGICGMFFNLLLPSPFMEDFRYIWTGPLFTFLFALAMTYAIFRYKLFNARAAISELLVFALVLVLLIRALLTTSSGELWLDLSVLAAVSVLGGLLIGSVNKEIRQRETIEVQKEEIERASAEKSEFMSFASHEIRNPVTAIKGYASLLLDGTIGTLDSNARDTVKKIKDLSEDIVHVTNDYLSKSKAELGQIRYERTKFDLSAVTKEIVEAMRTEADKRRLALRFNGVEGGQLPVRADLSKMKEVIRNLVDNAIKYTAAGSVTVSAERHGAIARVRVVDTGMGISPDAVPRLFSKFSRADARGANREGSGIGLYLAKLFVEGQDGTIRAESPGEGNGSTFTVEFPLAA